MKSSNKFIGFLAVITFLLNGCNNINTFTDSRDGQTYTIVKIGGQLWFAENLKFDIDNSWCSNDDPINCKIYGRLYDWEAALSGCPAGWHLPSDAEWTVLTDYLGGIEEAGFKMKSTSGWEEEGNGSNENGFSFLPGGDRSQAGGYHTIGYDGYWWSSTENGTDEAYLRGLFHNYNDVERNYHSKRSGFSVRCLKD